MTVSRMQKENHYRGVTRVGKSTLTMILFITMAMYFLLPIMWLMIASTKTTQELFHTPTFALHLPLAWIKNLSELSVYDGGIYWRWFLNSVVYSGVVGIVSTFISAMAGYALAKYRFRFKGVFENLVVAALAIPLAAMVMPIFLLVKAMGLMDTYTGVILPMLANPFGVYFLTTYLREAMPVELIESARIDGASDMRIFTRIALPITRPGLVSLFLIIFIGTWNNFFLPLVLLTKESLLPVTVGLNSWMGTLISMSEGPPLYPLILQGALLSILPMLVLFPFLRKHIASGLTMGGVKM
ncbi:L-arabinose transport system permease protein AraQ [Peptococcaceae bacterium CEB3]|nr:L-arabinose transport system permease protein AraQ [Peptococcaceae bacterium CEB3]